MSNLKLWLDTETMSFEQNQGDIIQLAGLIEKDGKLVDKFNYWVRPFKYDYVEPEIYEFHKKNLGITKEDIENFPEPEEVYEQFTNLLKKYVDPYDRNPHKDKFVLCGYNIIFDKNKLNSWFLKNGNKFLYSYLAGRTIDVYQLLSFFLDDLNLPSFKLENIWKLMVDNGVVEPIKGKNHSAVTDIKQTYMLYKKICLPAKELYKKEFLEG